MSLFAIGDLHLHYQSVLKAKDQLNSPLWADHEERFAENCRRLIEEEDTMVLVGDHSWGRNLEECEKDFEYIKSLPGRKILTRGNHDMFWDAKKTAKLNDLYYPDLTFLQDGYAVYKDFALVASKGYTFEGPFYLDRKGKIIGYDESDFEHAKKLVEREAKRLTDNFEAAKKDGYTKFIMFLHYPPTSVIEKDSVFTNIAARYNVSQVIYAHCHGKSRFHDSIEGKYRGREYSLVSGDYLNWLPKKIMG
jgi:predicted phosphohydrolase